MIENLTDEEIIRLKATKSEQEWNDVCDEIKTARDGQYPNDWFMRVMVSGLAEQIKARWH